MLMAIRNSPRAFFAAILPLAVLQAGLFASRLAGDMGAGMSVPSPDSALQLFVTRFAIDAAALGAGHLALRYYAISTRAAYGLMGGAAIALAYAFAYRHAFQLTDPLPGAVVTGAVVPVIVGMISGFLYAQFAGLDFADFTPLVPALPSDMPQPDEP